MHLDREVQVVVDDETLVYGVVAHQDAFAVVHLCAPRVWIMHDKGVGQVIKEELVAVPLVNHVDEVLLIGGIQHFFANSHVASAMANLIGVGALVQIQIGVVVVAVLHLEHAVVPAIILMPSRTLAPVQAVEVVRQGGGDGGPETADVDVEFVTLFIRLGLQVTP
eukprot:CAMPEP_0170463824 /NCGR_PEP_ID=MMETSP0123-20130129/8789_1 /TAXON_ID=182087 /ORGANISM="Favella ehrenbergii, Strain Fehren 1" /LENGTH=164 /DNA_ID=CAMNT_0010729349 /DNA_START=1500 /DNA_END=1994 /DNA_ORIENTATION=-